MARSQQGELWIRDLERGVFFGGGWQKVDSPGFAVHAFAAGGSDGELRLAVRGPTGQVSIGECRSGGPVHWRACNGRGRMATRGRDRPGLGGAGAWVGLSIRVRLRRHRASPRRRGRHSGAISVPARPSTSVLHSRLEVACQTPGQIEVFTQASTDDLVWTWWS